MAKIGSLLLDIQANVAKVQKDLDKAEKALGGALGRMDKMLKSFAGIASAYFGSKAIIGFVDDALKGADALQVMSNKTGVSVEALSALRHAANVSATDVETLEKGLQKLSVNILDAANGSQGAIDAFKQMGVDFKNTDGSLRNSDEVLMDLADKFQAMPDGTAKAAAAVKVFGKSGADLIPFLNNGRDGLAALKKEAEELGIVVGSDTAQRAQVFNDSMVRLQESSQGVGLILAEAALPYLQQMADWLIELSKNATGFKTAIDVGFKVVATVVQVVAGVFEFLGKRIGAVSAAIVEVLTGNFRAAGRIIDDSTKESLQVVLDRASNIKDIWTKVPEPVAEAAQAVAQHINKLPKNMEKAAAAARKMAAEIEDALLRAAATRASITRTQTDDIIASYNQQSAALKRKIEEDKATEAQKAAWTEELTALTEKKNHDLKEAEIKEHREKEYRKRDFELEMEAKRAKATADKLDDIEVSYAKELESLKRKLDAEQVTQAEFAEMEKQLLTEKEFAITELHNAEVLKRQKAQEKAYQQIATTMTRAFTDFVFAPLEEGFKGLEDAVKALHKVVLSLIKEIVMAGLIKAITGTATGGLGGALLTAAGFADGGYVGDEGPGTETSDDIWAKLSKREFVVKAKSVKKVGVPFLNWLNNLGDKPMSGVPAFARGGLVGGGPAARTPTMGGPVTVAPTFVVQAGGGLLHRQLLVQELGPALRQMAVEQTDNIIRQLGLNPAVVSSRG